MAPNFTYEDAFTLKESGAKISIRAEDQEVTCDFCGEEDRRFFFSDGDHRDICELCVEGLYSKLHSKSSTPTNLFDRPKDAKSNRFGL